MGGDENVRWVVEVDNGPTNSEKHKMKDDGPTHSRKQEMDVVEMKGLDMFVEGHKFGVLANSDVCLDSSVTTGYAALFHTQ